MDTSYLEQVFKHLTLTASASKTQLINDNLDNSPLHGQCPSLPSHQLETSSPSLYEISPPNEHTTSLIADSS